MGAVKIGGIKKRLIIIKINIIKNLLDFIDITSNSLLSDVFHYIPLVFYILPIFICDLFILDINQNFLSCIFSDFPYYVSAM